MHGEYLGMLHSPLATAGLSVLVRVEQPSDAGTRALQKTHDGISSMGFFLKAGAWGGHSPVGKPFGTRTIGVPKIIRRSRKISGNVL